MEIHGRQWNGQMEQSGKLSGPAAANKMSSRGVPDEVLPWKKALDVTCIALALPAVLFVMTAIAALIKLVSSGPVIFIQERVGYRGRRFRCYKFRSMRTQCDQTLH